MYTNQWALDSPLAQPRLHFSLLPGHTKPQTNQASRRNTANFGSTTTLLVGPQATPFTIHTVLLTSQSPYFRAALTGPFLESSTNQISYPDITVESFTYLTTYLYTSSITPLPFKDGKPAFYTLLHLYILGDRLCIEGLRNTVVDVISDVADATNAVLTPSDTRILYDMVPASSPLRKLVLDLFAFKKTDRLLDEHEIGRAHV